MLTSALLLWWLSAMVLGSSDLPPDYRLLVFVSAVAIALVYSTARVYRPVPGVGRKIWRLLRGWGLVVALLLVIGFLTKTSEYFSRPVLIAWFLLAPLLQGLNGYFVRFVLARRLARGVVVRSLVVGEGEHARKLVAWLRSERGFEEQVVGFVAEDDSAPVAPGVPHLGAIDDLGRLVREHSVRRVYLALPMEQAGAIRGIHIELLAHHVDIVWAPDIFGVQLLNHGIDDLGGMPVIYLSSTPLDGAAGALKALMDKTLALVGLVGLSPLLLVLACAVRWTSPGPAIFRQRRRGWDGREFTVYKFRSMYEHREEVRVTQARRGDARITPVGSFLRRTSLDELPQLVNVLEGSMSLVGPRPHAVVHDDFYGARIDAYMLRHRIKPGLTGLAQINGLRGETESIADMEARIQFDLLYINNWSIWLDLKILALTLIVLPFQKTAY